MFVCVCTEKVFLNDGAISCLAVHRSHKLQVLSTFPRKWHICTMPSHSVVCHLARVAKLMINFLFFANLSFFLFHTVFLSLHLTFALYFSMTLNLSLYLSIYHSFFFLYISLSTYISHTHIHKHLFTKQPKQFSGQIFLLNLEIIVNEFFIKSFSIGPW